MAGLLDFLGGQNGGQGLLALLGGNNPQGLMQMFSNPEAFAQQGGALGAVTRGLEGFVDPNLRLQRQAIDAASRLMGGGGQPQPQVPGQPQPTGDVIPLPRPRPAAPQAAAPPADPALPPPTNMGVNPLARIGAGHSSFVPPTATAFAPPGQQMPGSVVQQASQAIPFSAGRAAFAGTDPVPANYSTAVASIESGGRYDLLGPKTKSGDRAYGKYQVMGSNIANWTEKILGQRMTPLEFLANPDAQEAVFQGKFGEYVNKYGPGGAARAWFAGERGMHNPNARDQLGTTVASYERKFLNMLGGGGTRPSPGVQVAGLGGGVPLPPASPPPGVQLAQAQQPDQGSDLQPPQWAQVIKPPPPIGGQPQQPQGLGLHMTPRMRQAAAIMAIPGLPASYVAIAKGIYDQELALQRPTEAMRNYQEAQRDPRFGMFQHPPEVKDVGGVPHWVEPRSGVFQPISGPLATNKLATDMRDKLFTLPAYKTISFAAPVYKAMMEAASSSDDEVAKLNLQTGLAQLLDMGRAQSGDVAVIDQTQSLLSKLSEKLQKLIDNGQTLDQNTKQQIMQQAYIRAKAAKDQYDRTSKQFAAQAQRLGIDPSEVVPDFNDLIVPWQAQQQIQPVPMFNVPGYSGAAR